MTVSVSPNDLDTLLDLGGNINGDRAILLIGLALDECSAVVSPIPDSARGIVLRVAARAYLNPTGVQAQTVGPETVQYGATGIGVSLSSKDVADLRRLSGSGGAFTLDPTPADAGTAIYPWDRNIWVLGPNDPDFISPDGEWVG